MPFASLIGSLQAKQADFVISGMSYTDERAKSIDFSNKYATAKVGVLTMANSGIASVADLKGKKVACSAGTNYESIIKKIEGTELVTFDGQAAITQELLMGRVKASITGGTAVKKVASENKELSYFIIDSKELALGNLDTYNIAFPKGSELVPVFNKEISKLNEDGTLKKLITKWLGEDYVD
jgi:ABC-type amino acid transport substrate-binding protein